MQRSVNALVEPLAKLLSLVLLVLSLAAPGAVTGVHDIAHAAAPVAADEHHHHGNDGSVINVHSETDDGQQPEKPDFGHDHQSFNISAMQAVPTDRIDLTALQFRLVPQLYDSSREPPTTVPDRQLRPPRFA